MAKNYKVSVRNRLLTLLDSVDARIKESQKIMLTSTDESETDYHEGRKEALEVTRQQIARLFSEDLL